MFKVFLDAFENYWKFFTFDPPKYQLHSLSYQKQDPLFNIEALLLLQNVVTDTKIKKNKKTHHFENLQFM
ncbi:Sec23 trunk domain-containing protein [Aphis craccivora]|uniref:Sec23 trunk domain-containing protein n=1 Tax=Aphis craccivora TaxID=307492 RepID=A0A6G0WDB4_APHCR|nr:Sec23 trunk domain-containing protein [Aphis craccivora]